MGSVVIAYEPVWAIGTGKTATPEMAQEVHASIRALLNEKYGEAIGEKVRVLYGGSMKPANAADLLAQKDIDGGLIGGASLEAKSFCDLVAAAKSAS
jgi:triosephosphate isomerase